ncbi:hypothetical protein K1W54_24545 [Micromonospora sp. CPCC 205371]|nr:hypothetical protein [Micromonospora sp. CPCC 205371]
MPVQVPFALACAPRLAERASAAPTNLRRPGSLFANTTTLQWIVEAATGHRPVVDLIRCGVPFLSTPGGAPLAPYADRTQPPSEAWPAHPHEVIHLNQRVPTGAITGTLSVAHSWYLPLRPRGQRSLLEVMRAAAGYSHLAIDAVSLTLAGRRHRHPQPC